MLFWTRQRLGHATFRGAGCGQDYFAQYSAAVREAGEIGATAPVNGEDDVRQSEKRGC
jgi:hypothetical protein